MNKILFFILVILINSKLFGQHQNEMTFETLRECLIEDLHRENEIDSVWYNNLRSKKYTLNILGLQNNKFEGKLINGIYVFTLKNYSYLVLVEDKNYTLLNFKNKEEFNLSLLILIQFCDRNSYCYEITTNYVSKLISIYYNNNQVPLSGYDNNCSKGINNLKRLP